MTQDTRVLYNDNCPVCRFEIRQYAAYAQDIGLPLRFDDLNSEALKNWDLDADTAARRLYVLKDGQLSSGIPAFILLWNDMPRYQWLARVMSWPGVFSIACKGYDWLLAPVIYRWHLKRITRKNHAASTKS